MAKQRANQNRSRPGLDLMYKAFRFVGERALEMAMSTTLVLACFALFLWLLYLALPTGTSLGTLLAGTDRDAASIGLSAGDKRVFLADGLANNAPVAVLADTRNQVKAKGADTIVWSAASAGQDLMDRHSIQTYRHATARIAFDEQNELEVMQNTLVVIRRKDSSLLAQNSRSYSLTVDGELRGRLVSTGTAPVEVEVQLPSGIAKIQAGADSETPAEFNVKVNEDRSATVTVEKGVAEVISLGKAVTVRENQYTKLQDEAPPLPPRILSPAPELTQPAPGSVFTYRELTPRIELAWVASEALDGYRVVIARDRALNHVVFDRVVSGSTFTHGTLEAGTYYWQVAGIRRGGEVTARKVSRFRVVRDQGPPPLEVRFPSHVVESDRFLLEGETEPGIKIFVDGRQVETTADGRFRFELKLERGLNSIVVEAVDVAGNVAYRSEMVNAKY